MLLENGFSALVDTSHTDHGNIFRIADLLNRNYIDRVKFPLDFISIAAHDLVENYKISRGASYLRDLYNLRINLVVQPYKIEREEPRSDARIELELLRERLLTSLKETLKQGNNQKLFLYFGEGTRSEDGNLNKPLESTAMFSRLLPKSFIQPILIYYPKDFSGDHYKRDKVNWFEKARIHVGKPIIANSHYDSTFEDRVDCYQRLKEIPEKVYQFWEDNIPNIELRKTPR